jgi:hypothetical protein
VTQAFAYLFAPHLLQSAWVTLSDIEAVGVYLEDGGYAYVIGSGNYGAVAMFGGVEWDKQFKTATRVRVRSLPDCIRYLEWGTPQGNIYHRTCSTLGNTTERRFFKTTHYFDDGDMAEDKHVCPENHSLLDHPDECYCALSSREMTEYRETDGTACFNHELVAVPYERCIYPLKKTCAQDKAYANRLPVELSMQTAVWDRSRIHKQIAVKYMSKTPSDVTPILLAVLMPNAFAPRWQQRGTTLFALYEDPVLSCMHLLAYDGAELTQRYHEARIFMNEDVSCERQPVLLDQQTALYGTIKERAEFVGYTVGDKKSSEAPARPWHLQVSPRTLDAPETPPQLLPMQYTSDENFVWDANADSYEYRDAHGVPVRIVDGFSCYWDDLVDDRLGQPDAPTDESGVKLGEKVVLMDYCVAQTVVYYAALLKSQNAIMLRKSDLAHRRSSGISCGWIRLHLPEPLDVNTIDRMFLSCSIDATQLCVGIVVGQSTKVLYCCF